MARISKCIVAIITVILAISVFTLVGNAFAQTIPKLSVPEFTLNNVDYVVGGGLQIEIQNQQLVFNGYEHEWTSFDIRYKWHESAGWHNPEEEGYLAETGTTGVTSIVYPFSYYYEILGSSNSSEIDFQIRAVNGYVNSSLPFFPPNMGAPNDPFIVVSTSDWSNTQTIAISAESVSPSPSVPEFPFLLAIPILLLAIVVALAFKIQKLDSFRSH